MDMPYSIPANPGSVAYAVVVEERDPIGRIVESIVAAFTDEELAEKFCALHNEDPTTEPKTADVRVFALLSDLPYGYAPKAKRTIKRASQKLNAQDVLNIRALAQGGMTQVRIAERYGVTRQMISDIVRGKAWSWL